MKASSKNMPPILVCISSLAVGGAEQCVLAFAKAAIASGHEVKVLLLSNKGLASREPIIQNICSHVFLGRVIFLPIHVLLFSLRRPNSLIILNFWTIALPVCMLKVVRPQMRLVFWEHHWTSRYSPPAKFLLQLFFRKLNLVIGWPRSYLPLLSLCPYLSDKAFPIGNPIIFPSSMRMLERKNSIFTICICSRLEPLKNISLSIYCFSIAAYGRNMRLKIVGDGTARNDLEEYAASLNVSHLCEFYGFRNDALPILSISDLCLITSPKEGFCNVIIESLSVGTPVLSVMNGSIGDSILQNSAYGAVFDANNPDLIISEIIARYHRRRRVTSLDSLVLQYESLNWTTNLLKIASTQ